MATQRRRNNHKRLYRFSLWISSIPATLSVSLRGAQRRDNPVGLLRLAQSDAFKLRIAAMALILLAAVGCESLQVPPLPTPMPTNYLPTAIALTLEAGWTTPTMGAVTSQAMTPTGTPSLTPVPKDIPSPTTSESESGATLEAPSSPTITPFTLPPSPTPSPTPQIPNAEIEIRNLGALSRVTSPIHLYTYLKPGAGGKVRIELLGEDNRLLYREIRKVNFVPVGAWANLTMDIGFEISAPAEAARLKISVDDDYGRTVALNSVPLILLSVGQADIVPPLDVQAPIVVRQPRKKALIQGGKVVVAGLARPESDQPLMVRLITTKGAEVGFRLVEVERPTQGQYGTFAVEVPYQVSVLTPVLLVVQESVGNLENIIHLTSVEIMLAP